MTEEALVVFTPSGRRGRFPIGTSVLQAARVLGVDIDSVCGGRGLCGRCQVVLSEGEFAKHGVESRACNLSAPGEVEQAWAHDHGPLLEGRRLSCSTEVLGDVVIDVPPDSQVHRQIVRKRAEVRDIELDPPVRLHYVEVQQPDMHVPSSDLRRLKDALDFDWRLTGLQADIRVVHEATPPAYPKGPIKIYWVLGAAALAAVLGAALAFLFEYLNIRVRTIAEAERILGIPVLATLPHMEDLSGFGADSAAAH